MKFYKVVKSVNRVVAELEVDKHTESCIFWTSLLGNERKERKITNYSMWHESKKDALEYLQKRIWASISYKKEEIEKLESDMNQVSRQLLEID